MAGQLTIDTLKASTGVLATQNGMTGIAKAWVNFNGVTTATIRSSFNVSSVVRNSTGNYTVNFTTSMPNSNYLLAGSCNYGNNTNGASGAVVSPYTKTTSSIIVLTNSANAPQDNYEIDFIFFGA